MTLQKSPVAEVLSALSRGAETVEQALGGEISQHGGASITAIKALRQVNALRAAGPEGYRLHPRLREYLQDHLQIYPAFQSLAEIGSRITTVLSLWGEMDAMITANASDLDSMDSLESSLRSGVFDIVDSMERNMLQLQILIGTRYGNVESLALKKSQNRFYQGQTASLAGDMTRLSKVARRIELEAGQRHQEALAQFLRLNLIARVLPWQQGVSEIQTVIRQDIFLMRQIEQNHKQLARMDMLLRQQPGWRGFEADLSGDIPAFLLATKLADLQAHVEPMDTDQSIVSEMRALVEAMPAQRLVPESSAPPVRYRRIIHEKKTVVVLSATQALNRLIHDVDHAQNGISLGEWQCGDEDALTMEKGVWLVFATMALRSSGQYKVNLALDPPRSGEHFQHRFHDAFAYTSALYARGPNKAANLAVAA